MESCRFCGYKGIWKAGVINGKQRYKCKNCNKNQSEVDGRVKYSDDEKKYAAILYMEGCGFRRIARIMSQLFRKEYRYQTIMNWIKKTGLKLLPEEYNRKNIEIVEMAELDNYIQKKKEESNQGYALLLVGKRCVLLHLK